VAGTLPRTGPRRFSVALSLCLCVGCGRGTLRSQRPNFDNVMREYLRLAVALGERDPDGLDYYYGPPEWVADIRGHPPSLPQIKTEALALVRELEQLPVAEKQNVRRTFLLGQLRAIAVRCDVLRGVFRGFDQEAELLFGIHLTPVATPGLSAVRVELERLLAGRGELAGRYAAFDEKFMIPPERVPSVMQQAIQACRDQTLAHWKLPPGESVTLEYVHNKPWSAYSFYQGNYHSTIRVNLDLPLTVDRALQLACHEGYPGHHVFNSFTEEDLVRGQKRPEFLVQPTFSPQSLLSEAAATVAPDIAFSSAERVRLERGVLFPLAGLQSGHVEQYVRVQELVETLYPAELAVARDYLDGRLEFVRAAAALSDRALMTHSEETLRYLNEYRTYVVAYTEGRARLVHWIQKYDPGQSGVDSRWTAFRRLIAAPGHVTDHDCPL
jgi:hypothetical protein